MSSHRSFHWKPLETNIKRFYIAVLSTAQFWLLTYDTWVISHAIGFNSVGGDNYASKSSVIDLSSIWLGTAVVKYWRTLFVLPRKDIMASKRSERRILSKDFALKPEDFFVIDNWPIHLGRAEILSLFLDRLGIEYIFTPFMHPIWTQSSLVSNPWKLCLKQNTCRDWQKTI